MTNLDYHAAITPMFDPTPCWTRVRVHTACTRQIGNARKLADTRGNKSSYCKSFIFGGLLRTSIYFNGLRLFTPIMFSHGRGSNGLYYAWFAEFLASHGYIVAALNHYRANTYDSTIAYLANKLWQRPRDVALSISFLLNDPLWGKAIDADRIGVAGHSQGGFTALWVRGASINPEKYLAFQRGWRNNQMVPQYLRNELPLERPRRSTCTTNGSRPCSRWRPGSCRPSAWTRPGCGSSSCRPISRSAPAIPRRRPRRTPSLPRDISRMPSFA